MASLYEQDPAATPTQGSIFKFSPIFWIEPPLTLVRDVDPNRMTARIWRDPKLPSDAFRRGHLDNQEHVLAMAKVRYIVVLSPTHEARIQQVHSLVVAPIYKADPQATSRSDLLERSRRGEFPDRLFLLADPDFPEIGEAIIDFRNVQPLRKELLPASAKTPFRFNDVWRDAIIARYRNYFVTRPQQARAQ